MSMTITDLGMAIMSGAYDDQLDSIQTFVRERQNTKGRVLAMTLNVGDKVRFVNGRPKYLNGCTATIVDKKQKNLVIKFDAGQIQGYKYAGRVTCPPTLLERIEDNPAFSS